MTENDFTMQDECGAFAMLPGKWKLEIMWMLDLMPLPCRCPSHDFSFCDLQAAVRGCFCLLSRYMR